MHHNNQENSSEYRLTAGARNLSYRLDDADAQVNRSWQHVYETDDVISGRSVIARWRRDQVLVSKCTVQWAGASRCSYGVL